MFHLNKNIQCIQLKSWWYPAPIKAITRSTYFHSDTTLICNYNRLPDFFIMTFFFCYATVSPSRWVNNYHSLTGKQCLMLPAVIWTLVLAKDVLITMAHRWQQIEPLLVGTTLTENIRKYPLLFFSSDYWRPKWANIPPMWKIRFFSHRSVIYTLGTHTLSFLRTAAHCFPFSNSPWQTERGTRHRDCFSSSLLNSTNLERDIINHFTDVNRLQQSHYTDVWRETRQSEEHFRA